METKVRPATDVLFCKKGGDLKCCFSNVKCVENFKFINDEVREGFNKKVGFFQQRGISNLFV